MNLSQVLILCALLFITCASAHNILYKYRLKCGPEGPPTKIEWMLFNDYGPEASLTSVGVTNGNVPGTTIKFGPTIGCALPDPYNPLCKIYEPNIPSWSYTGSYRSSFVIVTNDLVPNPTYAACKESGSTSCGNPFQTVPAIRGKAYWPATPYAFLFTSPSFRFIYFNI